MKHSNKKAMFLSLLIATLFIINAIWFYSMNSIWFFVGDFVSLYYLAYYFMGGLLILTIYSLLRLLHPQKFVVSIILLVISVGLLGLNYYIFDLGYDAWPFYVRTAQDSVPYVLFALFLYAFFVLFPRSKLAKYRIIPVTLLLISLLVTLTSALSLLPSRFEVGPVVFEAGDSYAIVWTTTAKGSGYVEYELGGLTKRVYDTYQGSPRTETSVHKVYIPVNDLEVAQSYTLHHQPMYLRGPYGAWLGATIHSDSYTFRPIDDSDGLQYYTIADSHDLPKSASLAAQYFDEDLDFLVLLGDQSSFLSDERDFEDKILGLASIVTQGTRPVIYVRGNHELKGTMANQLHEYVGTPKESFYYEFRLGPVYGVVLDLAEDHVDAWKEYFGLAEFEQYREDQLTWLEGVADGLATNQDYLTASYHLAFCHMPVTVKYEDDFLETVKDEYTAVLNEFNFDIMANGHSHQPRYMSLLDSGTTIQRDGETEIYTAFNFPSFISSRRAATADSDSEDLSGAHYIGAAVSISTTTINITYTNQEKEVVATSHGTIAIPRS